MKNNKKFYLKYTILFVLLSMMIIFFYYSQGKSLINYKTDGFRQHYRALLFTSDYLKQIFTNIFINHTFAIPQWDFSIGEGADITQTFHYYGINDPVLWLSVLVPDKYMYLFYDLAIFIRMYLAGLAFSFLCFDTNKKDIDAVLVGTLLYTFSGYILVNLSGHTIFLSALIYLPLIIAGCERIINGRRKLLLPIAACLSSIYNVYFFYMSAMMTITYVIVRLLTIDLDNQKKIKAFINIALYSVLGFLMSAIVFLPMAYVMFSSTRLSSHFDTPLLYDLDYYKTLLTSFTFVFDNYYGNYSLLALYAILGLFSRKDNKTTKVLFVLSFIFLAIPVIGLVFNAFMYTSNRWVFGIALLMSYIVVDNYERILNPHKYDIIFVVIYFVICTLLNKDIKQVYIMFILLALAIYVYNFIDKKQLLKKYIPILVTVFVIAFSIIYRYSPIWWNYVTFGTDIATIEENTYKEKPLLDTVQDKDFWRYSGDTLKINSSVNTHYNSSNFYWSIANDDVINMRKQIGLLDNNNHHYEEYDGRFLLNALSSTRYLITHKETDSISYGFNLTDTINGSSIYKSSYALPIFYGYENSISTSDWEKLNIIQRQEILSERVVLDNGENINNFKTNTKEIPFTITVENTDYNEHEIHSYDASSKMYLDVDSDEAGEYYLVVEGLDGQESGNWLVFNPEGTEKILLFKDDEHTANADKHDFIVNVGYYDGFKDKIRIEFIYKRDYTYDSLKLFVQPLDKQIEDLKKLNSITINSLEINTNKITAQISTDKDLYITSPIPYSKGWTAYVDNQKVDILKANLMYMTIPVEKGNHTITYKYSTPLLLSGTIITLISSGFYIYLLKRKTRTYHI